MTKKKYRVHDWVKFQYSEIGEYIDENHTDKPLRNDEIVDLLNEQHETIERLKDNCKVLDEVKCEIAEENEQLKKENQGIQDKVIRLLDYVEIKQCVTRTEIKKWWNGEIK